MTPAIQLGRRGRQRREVSAGKRPAANKADWRTTATAVGGIVSVLLVAVGLFYTNNANREQQRLGLDQQKLAFQGQVADRFTTAIGQLDTFRGGGLFRVHCEAFG
jgi:hypothetical protein